MKQTQCPKCKQTKFELTKCYLIGEYNGVSVNVIQCANQECLHIIGIADTDIITSTISKIGDIIETRLDKIESSISS